MGLGDILFEEDGNVTESKVRRVDSINGVTMEVSFESEITGKRSFPSGKDLGSGTMTLHPDGIVHGSYRGSIITDEGDQFIWWSCERSKVVKGGRLKGVEILTGSSHMQKLALSNLIIALEMEHDPKSKKFKITAYEWK